MPCSASLAARVRGRPLADRSRHRQHPNAPTTDRERDARDKPAEVLAFAGVKPGMTVVDMFAGGGYYTELLAGVVGPNGKVLAVNNVPYAQLRQGRHQGALHRRPPARTSSGAWSKPATSTSRRRAWTSSSSSWPITTCYWIDEKEGWPEINTDGFLESHEAHAQAGRQTTHRRSQRAGGHRQGNRGQGCIASTRTGRRRASPRTASCSRRPTTACATRTISSTRWFSTRRSRARPIATCTSTG